MSMQLSGRILAATLITLVSFAATAADVRVSCTKRLHRSQASVDGSNLATGSYRAVLRSGTRRAASALAPTIGDEAQFDFDSNPNDIAAGDTAIPANFIVDGRVRGFLVNSSGQRVTPVVEAICRIRN